MQEVCSLPHSSYPRFAAHMSTKYNLESELLMTWPPATLVGQHIAVLAHHTFSSHNNQVLQVCSLQLNCLVFFGRRPLSI